MSQVREPLAAQEPEVLFQIDNSELEAQAKREEQKKDMKKKRKFVRQDSKSASLSVCVVFLIANFQCMTTTALQTLLKDLQ